MKTKRFRAGLAALIGIHLLCGGPAAVAKAESFDRMPARGIVTMIDLGAKKCIPCKMMTPILTRLEKP